MEGLTPIYSHLSPFHQRICGIQIPFAHHIRWYVRWEGTQIEAESFVAYLNDNTCNLSFTYMFDESFTNFLDLTLCGNSDKGIAVTAYHKPSSVNSTCYSPPPSHVLKNVLVGELIRLKRHCSDSKDFKNVEAETLLRFALQGYPKWTLDRASNIVANIPRERSITSNSRRNGEKEKEPDIVFFYCL